jgi:ElaB/YqjD/DUF883 family membrane-anchored ribosome-binding protein
MASRRAKQLKKKVSASASGLYDLIDSAEELLESIKDQKSAAAENLREKVSQTVDSARTRLSELDVPEMASNAIDNTAGFLRADPWRAVAIGALALLAVSVFVRGDSDA